MGIGSERMEKLSKACLIIYVLVIVFDMVALFAQMGTSPTYDTAKAVDWVWRARATNDLSDMSNNLNKSYTLIEGMHGNPCWFFPTPSTDIDQIKLNIQECVSNCQVYSQLTDQMAYQQAVHNLQETLIEIADHLGSVSEWQYMSPFFMFYATLFVWVWAPMLALCIKYEW